MYYADTAPFLFFFFLSIFIMLSTCLEALSGTVGAGLACHMPTKINGKVVSLTGDGMQLSTFIHRA